jgi:hypothetical protein
MNIDASHVYKVVKNTFIEYIYYTVVYFSSCSSPDFNPSNNPPIEI